jgi:hypothetical protein
MVLRRTPEFSYGLHRIIPQVAVIPVKARRRHYPTSLMSVKHDFLRGMGILVEPANLMQCIFCSAESLAKKGSTRWLLMS